MAKIITSEIIIKISKIVKENSNEEIDTLNHKISLEEITQELVGSEYIVEVQ